MQALVLILQAVAAGTEAIARMRVAYETTKAQMLRDKQLTAAEAAELDAQAEKIFAAPASQPSGR